VAGVQRLEMRVFAGLHAVGLAVKLEAAGEVFDVEERGFAHDAAVRDAAGNGGLDGWNRADIAAGSRLRAEVRLPGGFGGMRARVSFDCERVAAGLAQRPQLRKPRLDEIVF